jgi:hypothetical protein
VRCEYGSVSRAAKGTDCKSVGLAFAGSSPARPTSFDLPGGENSSPLGSPFCGAIMIETAPQRIDTPVAWYAASDWLKPEEAVCFTGYHLELSTTWRAQSRRSDRAGAEEGHAHQSLHPTCHPARPGPPQVCTICPLYWRSNPITFRHRGMERSPE